ncbi:Golgi apyrase [Gryganskiella cystojenkinii]|nr:Golgi apyrase [Gryganskiella cystojenkinii]
MTSTHSEAWLRNRHFGIVIDAGSSGSRIHIYSWIDRAHLEQTTPLHTRRGTLPTIEPGVESDASNHSDWTKKTEPADFKDRPEDVGEHLEPLLDHAIQIIPESQIASTPIYLLATAGLRLVKDDVREKILTNSCHYIRENYNFDIGACKDHIRNISGEEEGIYGWVAINYLMGGFDKGGIKMIKPAPGSEQHDASDSESIPPNYDNGDLDDPTAPQSHRHTLGFLDMGGASTQIAFEPSPKASEEHANDLTAVSLKTLDGETMKYNVFVTTFLGYGSNQARRRYVKEYLLPAHQEDVESEKVIDDPCLPRNLHINETHTQPHVNLRGIGSFTGCLTRVEGLLNKDKECSDIPCLFNGVHTPPIDFNINTFIGVSEYWYSSHDILGLGGAYDYAEFERKSAEFCNSEWDDIKDRPEYEGQLQERLEMQCFKSAWLSNVLHGGFGLPRFGERGAGGSKEQSNEVLEKADESINSKNWRPVPFRSINAIKDIQVTWTLGAMLLISSGSMGPTGIGAGTGSSDHGGHKPTEQVLPPAKQGPPHEDTYPERMLDSYNHFMLLAIVLFGLAVFWVYRSRSSKSWPTIRRWLGSNGSSLSPGGGGSNGGLPLFGRFRRTSGPSNTDYSALESGAVGAGAYGGRSFSPRASFKVFYLSVVHHTRSVWWSLTSRIWPEPTSFDTGARGTEEMMESITIAGFDGSSSTAPTHGGPGLGIGNGNIVGVSHHGGTPAGSLGSLGLSAIPEMGSGVGNNGLPPGSFEGGYHRSHSSMSNSSSGSRPPKTTPRFFRINKKRFSGDSQSLFASTNNNNNGNGNGKDGRNANVEGCVVNTALLQKQPHLQSSVELTARSGSSSNLSSGWKQGWIPEDDQAADATTTPMPSMLTSSRSFNAVGAISSGNGSAGGSPLLTPMARYKQQQLVHQDGSSSAPTSSVNLSGYGAGYFGSSNYNNSGASASGIASGFVTSADERDEWSADGGDGDDEGEGYMDRHHSSLSTTGFGNSHTGSSTNKAAFQQYQQQVQYNQQQYSHTPFRSASAIPFSDHNPNHTGRNKQRATGIMSGINFESGIGAMTSLDDGQESASEAGYLSGASSTGGRGRRSSGGLMPISVRASGARSVSPMPSSAPQFQTQQQHHLFNLQQVSTSTSSLVLGRHNITEQDQQLVSRGSSENVRRGSSGTVMSP